MSDLTALTTGDHVSVLAEVVSSKLHRPGGERSRKSRVEVVISDGTGTLTLVFFNQPGRKNQCAVGRKGLFEGVVSSFQGRRQLTHPRLLMLPSDPKDPDYAEAVELFTDRLIPIYPASKAMPTWKISQAVGYVLKELRAHPDLDDSIDPLPEELRERRDSWASRRRGRRSTCPRTCSRRNELRSDCASTRPSPSRRCWRNGGNDCAR